MIYSIGFGTGTTVPSTGGNLAFKFPMASVQITNAGSSQLIAVVNAIMVNAGDSSVALATLVAGTSVMSGWTDLNQWKRVNKTAMLATGILIEPGATIVFSGYSPTQYGAMISNIAITTVSDTDTGVITGGATDISQV